MSLDSWFIKEHEHIASKFGLSYSQLSQLIYPTTFYSYKTFNIPKKNGKERVINAPKVNLLGIQRQLAEELTQAYQAKPSSHGFIKGRSIVTNAKKHTRKRFVFNIDLEDFFGSIHFGRVRNLFMSSPLNYSKTSATILAQICCHDGVLPQGAPTSPIVSNMICWKLDAQLQTLAKKNQCTYTRYADDITFSFSSKRNKLPLSIIKFEGEDSYSVGQLLTKLIEDNGFRINNDKVRLQESNQRQEVTGLTVNRKVNIQRSFIRQTNSMLHAWKKFGAKAAEDHYLCKYREKKLTPWQERIVSKKPGEFFINVVKGRINYIQMVRGRYDPIFRKLAFKLTENLGKPNTDFQKSFEELATLVLINNITQSQGTGFLLDGIGLVTNAHVTETIDNTNDELLEIHHYDTSEKLMRGFHIHSSLKYDISIFNPSNQFLNLPRFSICEEEKIQQGDEIKVIGFPSYSKDSIPYINEGKIVSRTPHFELTVWIVDTPINHGCSGAPILNHKRQVVGIATFGTVKHDGSTEYNGFIPISTLIKQTEKTSYIIKKHEAKNRQEVFEIKKRLKSINTTKNTYYLDKNYYCRACLDKGNLITLSPTKDKNLLNCKICMKLLEI